ncbi:MAG: prepilin peptidase [Patescibacteria group bacterium]|nr:prepilin peptidase [Patescibacteria group bacterium]MDE2438109.1 prepilin peptidase [Patescibacteria group bacterium]
MIVLLGCVVFFIGMSLGSFANVLVDRFDPDYYASFFKITSGRSRCDFCSRTLLWYELIPLASFMVQRGRARCCGKNLSLQYPLLEFGFGLLCIGIWLRFSSYFPTLASAAPFLFWSLVGCGFLVSLFLIALARIDARTYLLPDMLMGPGIIMAFVYGGLLVYAERIVPMSVVGYESVDFFLPFSSILSSHVLGALFFGGALYAVYAVSRGRAMGFGDVKLGVFEGLFLGAPLSLVALFFSFLLGSAVGSIALLIHKKHMKDLLPFGPFLVAGFYVAFFAGEWILRWYFGLMNI